MRPGARSLSFIIAACTAAALGPAAAARPADLVARIACGPTAAPGCAETGTETLPGNSYGSEQTDVVPASATSATEQVDPAPGSDLAAFDAIWATIVQDQPKLGKLNSVPLRRFITCHVFAQAGVAVNHYASQTYDSLDNTYASSYLMTMGACLSLVSDMQAKAAAGTGAPAQTASAACNQTALRLPVSVSRVGNRLRLQIRAAPTLARGRTQLAVSCRRTGAALRIGIRPARRGTRLASAVGPHLQIGFANPTARIASIRTTYTFH